MSGEHLHLHLFSFFRLGSPLFPFRFDYNQDKTNDRFVKTRELLAELMSVISHTSVKNEVKDL